MNHPPYHLRHNKAVDRFLFIELLSLLGVHLKNGLNGYTYYGLGGPFLEDFQAIHQSFPEMNMICIERCVETHKRQKFNKPHKKVAFFNDDMSGFFGNNELTGKDIIWLDFTNNTLAEFELFQFVLGKLWPYGILKVTLNANALINEGMKEDKKKCKIKKFTDDFEDFLPPDFDSNTDLRGGPFKQLLFKMLKLGSQKILDDSECLVFQPLFTSYYQDGAPMLTLTGIVLPTDKSKQFVDKLSKWKYLNPKWEEPKHINVPTLSLRERLVLDKNLPISGNSVKRLKSQIPFELGENSKETCEKIKQYADFYRFYPYFTKVVV
jgi:hypothetical protein